MKYFLAIAAVLAACCALLLRSGPVADVRRTIVVNGAPAPNNLPPAGTETPVRSQPAAGTTSQVTDPRQLYASLRSERRDTEWAEQSETFIKATIAANPDLGAQSPIEVRCATTLCEASGVAALGAQPDVVQRAWLSLRGTIDTPLVAAHGLQYVTGTFGSGHSIHAFTVYYQRRAD